MIGSTSSSTPPSEAATAAAFLYRPVLRELFEIEVFRFLREKELLSKERVELIRSWRYSGFDVYVGAPIEPGNRQMLEHIACYLLRAPVSLERMWHNP